MSYIFRIVTTDDLIKSFPFPSFAVKEYGDADEKEHFHVCSKIGKSEKIARTKIKDHFGVDGNTGYGGFKVFNDEKKDEFLKYCSKGPEGHFGRSGDVVLVIRNDLFPSYDPVEYNKMFHSVQQSKTTKLNPTVVHVGKVRVKSKSWSEKAEEEFIKKVEGRKDVELPEIVDFLLERLGEQVGKAFVMNHIKGLALKIYYKLDDTNYVRDNIRNKICYEIEQEMGFLRRKRLERIVDQVNGTSLY